MLACLCASGLQNKFTQSLHLFSDFSASFNRARVPQQRTPVQRARGRQKPTSSKLSNARPALAAAFVCKAQSAPMRCALLAITAPCGRNSAPNFPVKRALSERRPASTIPSNAPSVRPDITAQRAPKNPSNVQCKSLAAHISAYEFSSSSYDGTS